MALEAMWRPVWQVIQWWDTSPPSVEPATRCAFKSSSHAHPCRCPIMKCPINNNHRQMLLCGGVFAQRAHSAGTAPIITVIIQVTTLKTTHLQNHAQSIQNSKIKHLMLAMGPRDLISAPYSPVHCSSHSMTSFQPSELTELPVVENSQLFAQRTVRPLCV